MSLDNSKICEDILTSKLTDTINILTESLKKENFPKEIINIFAQLTEARRLLFENKKLSLKSNSIQTSSSDSNNNLLR